MKKNEWFEVKGAKIRRVNNNIEMEVDGHGEIAEITIPLNEFASMVTSVAKKPDIGETHDRVVKILEG